MSLMSPPLAGGFFITSVTWEKCPLPSCVQLFSTAWTVICQVPLSMRFSRQEYWSGLPFLPPRNLPDPGIETMTPAAPPLQVNSSTSELP